MFDVILFDLDGTLTDSETGIINSVIYALSKFSIEIHDRAELNKFIGPPLLESFERFYGFTKEQSMEAVKYYREYYGEKGIFENRVYEGIEDLLKTLSNSEKTLITATSKPEGYAQTILDHFNLSQYFTYVAGSNYDGTRAKKDEVILYALNSCGITESSSEKAINYASAVMIGDRKHDIIGAKKVGIKSIGVLYGYGSIYELNNAGADYIASNTDDLSKLLI